MANLIFHSLAARYAEVLRDLENVTGKKLKRLCVVGGGSKNALLNRLTKKATGLQIVTGSVESSTVGNFAIQLAALADDYQQETGVTASAVAEWAGVLASCPIVPTQLQALSR
jgi:rhamnulokinase